MYQTILRQKRYVKKLCAEDHTHWGMFLTMLGQKICEKAVEEDAWWLYAVSDYFKTQGMCERAVEKNPWQLKDVPNHFKTGKMCEKVVEKKQKP